MEAARFHQPRNKPDNGTILVIDDDHFFTELVSLHLLLAGHTVQVARDGRPARRRRRPPELILLDLDLPYMSGFEVLEALRSDPATRKIPVIMLTAHKDEESYARCNTIGIDGFLTKPLQSDKLTEAIAVALAAHAQN